MNWKGDPSRPPSPEVPPALEAAWIRQLRRFYSLFNYEYVRSRLRPPIFRIGSAAGKLGEWNGVFRCITISARHILEHPWENVLETLRHEMAHQYVEEILGFQGAPPHGEPFVEACRILRVDPVTRDPGHRGRLEDSVAERDKILHRVKLLLALAHSPNEHEAANAMRMAQKYLLKYNLQLADAQSQRSYDTRYLGKCSARIQEYEYVLARILQDHFFVCVIWYPWCDPLTGKAGRVLEISGTPENLEMAEYVYKYVMSLTEPLWEAHRRSAETRGGTRLQYLAGLLRGFQEKLDGQRAELREERGLVWRGDPGLEDYYRYRNPRIRHTRVCGVSRGARYAAGLEDGREITIRKGIRSETQSRGRLLPGV